MLKMSLSTGVPVNLPIKSELTWIDYKSIQINSNRGPLPRQFKSNQGLNWIDKYSLLHDQLPPPPPLWRDLNSLHASNFAWLPPAVRSNCSEAIYLAARTLFLEAFLRSAVIFVKCCKVSTRTTLPNLINISAETVLYSRFGGHNGRRSKGGEDEAYGGAF